VPQYACERFVDLAELLDDPEACAFTATDDGDLLEACLDQASDIIYLLSGGRITGICTRTVRPVGDACRPRTGEYGQVAGWLPYFGGVGTIPLRQPNTDIVEIVIDGVVLNPAEYGLMDEHFLYRKTGAWPSVNDLTLDDSNDGTWSVTYRFGRPPDKLTRMATIELAVELANDAIGKETHLPPGITSANIQGASVSLQDRAEALRNGSDQLPKLSRFIGVFAPEGPARSGVYSPELRHGWNLVEVEGPSAS